MVPLLKDNCEVEIVTLIEWKRVVREDICDNSCTFCVHVGKDSFIICLHASVLSNIALENGKVNPYVHTSYHQHTQYHC